jgi:hypothetical protein
MFLEAMTRLSSDLTATQHEERAALQRIDAAFRSTLELDDRPYSLADGDSDREGGHVVYEGTPLTAAQEQRVLHYIDFIRSPSTG